MISPMWRWVGGAATLTAIAVLVGCGSKTKDTSGSGSAPPGGVPGYGGGSKGGPPGGMPGSGMSGGGMPGSGGAPSPPVSSVFALGDARVAAIRASSVNNLKQIGLAFHNHSDAYNGLPIGVSQKDGRTGLSWRVAILPFIEQDLLYKQFKLDEPWDSEHNKKLIEQMPRIYDATKGSGKPGYTYYRTFVGRDAVLNWPQQGGQGGKNAIGGQLSAIPDGTSNTALVVEAGEAVIWTKPEGLEYDASKPPPQLGGVFGEGFNVLLCDGSVRFISKSTPEKTIRAIITARGGEVVDFP